MTEPAFIHTSRLIVDLEDLMALIGQADRRSGYDPIVRRIAAMMEARGLTTEVFTSAGAPIVIGRRAGRSPYTLLLYHHYDVAPAGPWRHWHQDPYLLAERDGVLYGRGVSEGIGPLVTQLNALAALIEIEHELPCEIVMVVEGEQLIGSPALAGMSRIAADAVLAVGGELDARGVPFCYAASKGFVQVLLEARGARSPLLTGMAASVGNPLWQIVWALGAIKNDQEEVLIDDFYDSVTGPTREESRLLRAVTLDEAARHRALGTTAFVAGLTGMALIQAETTLPTCNVSAITFEPEGDLARIPTRASARVDFTLVPAQSPELVVSQTRAHLATRSLGDVQVLVLPGGYSAAAGRTDDPFVRTVCGAICQIVGAMPTLLPCAPLQLPLTLLCSEPQPPVVVIGFATLESAPFGANEHIALGALVRHGQLLIELLYSLVPPADVPT